MCYPGPNGIRTTRSFGQAHSSLSQSVKRRALLLPNVGPISALAKVQPPDKPSVTFKSAGVRIWSILLCALQGSSTEKGVNNIARVRTTHSSTSVGPANLELVHGTPIPCLDDTRRDPVFGRHTAAQASVSQPARSHPRARARARHPDLAFGRHTAVWASVLQPARSHPRARARYPDPAFGRHGAIPRSDDTRQRRSRSLRAPTLELELAHGTPIPRLDDTRRCGRQSCSRRAPTLELVHGTPIPRLDDTARSRIRTTHGSAGVGPAACAFPSSSSRTAPRSPVWTTHGCDPAFGRHTAAQARQTARSMFGRHTAAQALVPQRARARHSDPAFGRHMARSRVRTTHGCAGVGPAARTLPPSSSRTAPRSRVWTTHGGAGVRPAARALPPPGRSNHLLELTHGTPIPRSDDTRTRQGGRRSRSPGSHLTCMIPAATYLLGNQNDLIYNFLVF
ncbi:hypothetical protein B0H14DRAFT_2620915 [Mycena olivaceomarginata]|nr:hypothetical protein B0H14DRAFT_2620915 [Mycena olivaceomarginata]